MKLQKFGNNYVNHFFFIFFISMNLFYELCHGQSVKSFFQTNDRIIINLSEGILSISPLDENAVRIKFYKVTEPDIPEFIFTSSVTIPEFYVSNLSSTIEVKMKNMMVIMDKQTGCLSFKDNSGKIFLSEKDGTRKLIPNSVLNKPCAIAELSFISPKNEYIFGLGQFQDGYYNLKNVSRRLTQVNSQIAIPFIYSNMGYGLLWHQYGLTDFNPADNFITLEKQDSFTGDNKIAEVTTTSGTQKILQDQALYTGKCTVPEDGEYSIFLDLGDMGNRQYVVIDGNPCIDQSNLWLPPAASALVYLKAGDHQIQVVCKSTNVPRVSWKPVNDVTTFRSPNANLIDYVVFYGPSADEVIASYRKLSGDVPMLPLWAYGFWQCRERYISSSQLVETAKEFKKRNLPMDVIVQDWQYWGKHGWGVPQFDEISYPDPSGFINELHDLNTHFCISVWSNPDKNSKIGQELVMKNLYIPNSPWLDYFNPLTRETYWNILKENLFFHGVDSWWMDATEPENDALAGKQTYIGTGDFYRLTYPLFASKAVYEGQRATTSSKRVCILTRSAFSGQQRYGIINWSGDIGGNWDSYKRQIVAGLNYSITGFPYWTTDIGGFFRPGASQYYDKEYHELLIRWFQWGTFNPIFRIHGYQTETEPWKYGPQVEENIRKMLNLRYHFMPYIYSEAWQVTKNGSTMMRPLVMDFREDTSALSQFYEYMFGKALLVTPITEPNASLWNIYLPGSCSWYDFWTGEKYNGGKYIEKEVPIDIIPLYVKAGSIIPFGPKVQYTTEKRWDSLEIRIYEGADGTFTLYEDEGDNYNYEKGMYSTIAFLWDDAKKTLTIGDRKGSFPSMLIQRKFKIVRVTENKGIGMKANKQYDKVISYNGKRKVISF
ncbi:MAG TPA: glycoside hydrolase family 31 protein [Bacteroidales bacterium]|nr:glycoside hydrolase family 31 protein [Bacteroidales bacterium]